VDRGFPRTCRILFGREFERVMREGRKVHTRNLVIFVAPGAADSARLGLAVGRRVGNAVCRNRWKRLVREVFRLKLRGGLQAVDLVVAVKAAPGRARPSPGSRPDPKPGRSASGRGEQRVAPGYCGLEGELIDAIRRLGALGEIRDAGPG
jgi:ribonuclease P protein component